MSGSQDAGHEAAAAFMEARMRILDARASVKRGPALGDHSVA